MNSRSTRNEIIELADAMSLQQLDDAGSKRLQELLQADRSHLQFYVEYMDHLAVLSTRFLTEDPEDIIRRNVETHTLRVKRRSNWKMLLTNSVLTLMLLFSALGVYGLVTNGNPFSVSSLVDLTPRKSVARIVKSIDGKWTISNPNGQNSMASSGAREELSVLYEGDEIHLEHGLLEILFHNNAKVQLHGNTRCRLTGGNDAFLAEGKAVSEVPPSAVGFRLDTSTLKICDLGTRFAVTSDDKGDSELAVYDGHVMVGLQSDSDDKSTWRSLTERQAVKYKSTVAALEGTEFSFKVFDYIAAAMAGVTDYSGNTKAVERPEELKNQINVIAAAPIFRGKTFSNVVAFDLIKGDWNPKLTQPQGKIQPGSHNPCDVFLVQRKASPTKLGGQVTGEIRFSQPIIGVLLTPKSMDQVGQLFKDTPPPLSKAPGSELELTDNKDKVTILKDRHTIQLNLSADDEVDQLIVFTAGY